MPSADQVDPEELEGSEEINHTCVLFLISGTGTATSRVRPF